MEETSMQQRKQERYLKGEARKKKQQTKGRIIAGIISIICVSMLLVFLLPRILPQKSVYQALCDDGYTGSQEQLIASLAGETMDSGGDTAYTLAVKNGYRKSYEQWIETLTGAKNADERQSAYRTACANGFEGSLSQWLTHISANPEGLGKSKDGNPTEYELACEYGFTGTFIEWIVSLINE